MKSFLNGKAAYQKNNACCEHCSGHLLDRTFGLYVEGHFREILNWERKRTERSRKPFMLMLLGIGKIPHGFERDTVTRKTANVLFSVTRQTDPKGWYRDGSVIGVIFTEPREIDDTTADIKIYKELSRELGPEDVRKIEISTFVYPEKKGRQGQYRPPDLNLYPDLLDMNFSRKLSLSIKRAMDVAGAALGALVFSPFFVIVPIAIILSSRGPVLFRQERVGRQGRKFMFLKFRTMFVGNDESVHREYVKTLIQARNNIDEDGVFKIKDDSRVTRIGGFLRKSSLDELPQFFNVLKGDMSLVGPRPPIPYELDDYDIWHRRRVLEARPGITGLWQVEGRSSTTFDEMVRMDLKYISEWSVWLDIKILLQTPRAVLSFKGAY